MNTINFHQQKEYKSVNRMLEDYFTRPSTVNVPQTAAHLYKHKINDTVVINATPAQRKKLNFKYSLNPGNTLLK